MNLMGVEVDTSRGLCRPCINEKIAEEEELYRMAEDARIARQRRTWRENCGIPLKYLNEDFGTFDQERPGNVKVAYKRCLAYALSFPLDYSAYVREGNEAYPSLLLFSTDVWRIGKTHLAAAIGHEILNRWKGEDIICPVEFISEPDLYRRIQATYSYSQEEKQYRESEDDIIRNMIYRPLLILDDVGKEKRTDPRFVQRTLFAIIDGRNKNLRPMVVTSNMGVDALKRYLGANDDEANFKRLWEMCNGKFIKLTGESYRRK
jgi:hypothetical protein